ncbi:primosomal protein N' [Legionella sp. CNM-4043-24]|uniref:primosomal protein N' n=1 Tax=Legionella sp. CNM-4043-24 TaxID=3421646 RepID=UPI00403AF317
MDTCLKICIPHTSRDSFDYLSGPFRPVVGARVQVPFRNKTRVGIIIGHGQTEKAGLNLKVLSAVIDDTPVISADLMQLAHWVSRYYQSPLSEVLPLVLPKMLRLGGQASLPLTSYYQLNSPLEEARSRVGKRASRQLALLDFLASQDAAISRKRLAQEGFNKAQLDSLDSLGLLTVREQIDLPCYHNGQVSPPLNLNEEQAQAVDAVLKRMNSHHGFLLQGVTGSGKTEVYLQIIAEVLATGRQVLVLVPEIGLTPQLLARFSSRFLEPIAVIHSQLSDGERAIAWQSARERQVKLVIGTRSAIFTPMPDLALIIIDEEHDSSLKQMDGVRYSARDTALIRAQQANIPVILGSATPSLESVHNCQQNKYSLLRLTQKATVSSPLRYQIVDLRNQAIREGLAAPSLSRIDEHVKRGNQVLVFINRRGFAPVLLCHLCGWMVDCRACDSHLTLHRQTRRLNCHHCGLSQAIPAACRACGGRELLPVGTGTQRIHEYLQQQFPDVTVLRIDRDEVRRKNELNERLDQINQGQAQIIVGTQMLAKGHHFPRLTLVVVVDMDSGFYNQDFRSIEQLGQLLVQVAGRAGRAEHPGEVLIQTHLPQHPLLNTLIQQGYDAFADNLLETRQQAALPPYHYLAVIRAEDKDLAKITNMLQQTKTWLATWPVHVLGPAPAPLARKANQHRMQLLLKSASRKQLHGTLTAMRSWLTMNRQHNGIRWNIDVDPQDLS